MEQLNKVLAQVQEIVQDEEKVNQLWIELSVRIAAHHWKILTYGVGLANFDKLACQKLRTKAAGLPERYMRCLLSLDSIEINDDQELRQARRQLVKRINSELLPSADKSFKRSEALLALDSEISTLNQLLQKNEDKFNNMEVEEQVAEEKSINENEDQQMSDDEEEEVQKEPMSEDEESDVESDEEDAKEPEEAIKPETETNEVETKEKKPLLRYNVSQGQSNVSVKIPLPKNVDPREITIGLNEKATELTVMAPGYEKLVLDVSSKSIDPTKTKFAFDRRTWSVVIDIPHKVMVRKPEPYFSPFYQQQPRYQRRFVPRQQPNIFYNRPVFM